MTISQNAEPSHFNIPLGSKPLSELARRASEAGKNINEMAGELLSELLTDEPTPTEPTPTEPQPEEDAK